MSRSLTRSGAASGVRRPRISRSVPSGSCPRIRATSVSSARSAASRAVAASPSERRSSIEAHRDPPPVPALERGEDAPDAGIADVRDEGPVAAGPAVRDPLREGLHHLGLVEEDVRMVPFGRHQDGDVRPVRIEVARVLVGLDHEVRPAPETRDAALWSDDRGRQVGPDEPRRVATGTDQQVQQPARGRRLAVRARDADEPPAAGGRRVGHDLLHALGHDPDVAGRHELGMVGLDRGDRLGDGQTVDDGPAVGPAHVRSVVAPVDRDAGREDGTGHRVRPARIACGHRRPDRRSVERRTRGGRPADPDDMDPGAGRDRHRVPRRREAAGDVLVGAGHPAGVSTPARASARSARNRSASAALASLFAARSPAQWNRRTSVPSRSLTPT